MQIDINLLPRQSEILADPHRFKVLVCGRRFGKTQYCAIEHVIKALSGKGNGVQWMVAPTYPLSKIMWRKTKSVLRDAGLMDFVSDIKEGDLYMEFINGTTLWCKSADKPDNLVGEGLDHVSLDEYGIMKEDVWSESIRPTLLDTGGSATFIGTPKGKNHFYDIFCINEGSWVSYRHSSYENPLIDPEELVEIVKDMPEMIYQQEILAEFIEEGGTVFKTYQRQLTELQPIYSPDNYIVYGIDFGKLQDFTVIVGYDALTCRPVFYERFNKIDWDYQINRIKTIVSKTPNHLVMIDSSGVGEPLYDDLKKSGLCVRAVTMSSGKNINVKLTGHIKYTVPKNILIERLAVSIEIGEFFLPLDSAVKKEFDIYTYNITPSGNISYGAPPGKNDDTVIACSLAHYGIAVGCCCVGGITSDIALKEKIIPQMYGEDVMSPEEIVEDVYDYNLDNY